VNSNNLLLYGLGLAAALAMGVITWALSVAKRNVAIVDSIWSLMFIAQAGIYVFGAPAPTARGLLVVALVAIWGLRLSLHITVRSRGHGEDRRYQAIRERNEPGFAFKSLYLVFALQAVLAWIISLPLIGAARSDSPLGLLDGVGIALWLVGDGSRAVAVDAASQLLRRFLRVVGAVPHRAVGGRVVERGRSAADVGAADARVGRDAAGEGHRRASPAVRRVYPAHQRVLSGAAQGLNRGAVCRSPVHCSRSSPPADRRPFQPPTPYGRAMPTRTFLKLLFSAIFLTMLVYTSWASLQQPVLQWQGLTAEPDRYWTIATLLDAYFGFITFYVWVCFKESRALPRVGWFVAIMLLGNMAMSAYVLLQLLRLRPDQPVSDVLTSRSRAV